MHVLCPSCETEYEIPPLRRPRKLRCARCASEWQAMPEPEQVAAPTVAEDPPEPEVPVPERVAAQASPVAETVPPPMAAPPERRMGMITAPGHGTIGRGDLLIALCWLLSLAVIAAGLWALWHWRGPIGHRWPPSLRLYRLLPHGGA